MALTVCPDALWFYKFMEGKVKNIQEDSLDSITSSPPSVKIQIMGGKVGLRCKGKTLLVVVNKLFVRQRPAMFDQKHLKKKFKCSQLLEGDGIESRLTFKISSTLHGMAKDNLNKSKEAKLTNTTELKFRTNIYFVKVPLNVKIVKQDLFIRNSI